jgi:hypothetical protein
LRMDSSPETTSSSTAEKARRRWPITIGRLSLLLIGLLTGVVIAEAVASFLPPPYKTLPALFECSNELGWRGRPDFEVESADQGHYKLNSQGMHDVEHSWQKAENSFRILMLGDSLIAALQVLEEQTAHQVLEDLLNEQVKAGTGPAAIEVIGAGVGAWGNVQEALYYRYEGYRYNPDLVLLAFFPGNDLLDNLPGQVLTVDGVNCYSPYFVLCNGVFDSEPWLFAPGIAPAWKDCPAGKKQLTSALGALYQRSQAYKRLEPLLIAGQKRLEYSSPYAVYLPVDDPVLDYAWQLTEATILQMRQDVEAHGARFAVVIIGPARVFEWSLASPEQLEPLLQVNPELRNAQSDRPNRILSEFLREHGIPVLDLQGPMLEYARATGAQLYFYKESHWTPEGNRVAARLMSEWLSQSGLIPALPR